MNAPGDRAIDELLVLRCQAGSRNSWELLVRRWQRRLWWYARRLTDNDEAAWDATQETWMAILKRIRELRDPLWFAAWAYRIVRNKCADRGRRNERQKRAFAVLAERLPMEAGPAHDDCDELSRAVRRLPPDRQELLLLRYSANLTCVEIAVILAAPVGTIKSRLHLAREELRRILEGVQT
ncbi:MAG: sigma-70 family RNA polymerase sigma factor [Planctomycetes bacterium]|nr:sigma-70 family RNA polymerase sigma factor [Planctomycetota bacterium]